MKDFMFGHQRKGQGRRILYLSLSLFVVVRFNHSHGYLRSLSSFVSFHKVFPSIGLLFDCNFLVSYVFFVFVCVFFEYGQENRVIYKGKDQGTDLIKEFEQGVIVRRRSHP